MESDKETMGLDQEGLRHAKSLLSSEETIKANISFRKGLIVGLLILVLVLAIGFLLGYAVGQNIATNHYTEIIRECQNKTLFLPF